MPVARVQVTLERQTGASEDRVVNVFHFNTANLPITVTLATTLATRVIDFYTKNPAPDTNNVFSQLSNLLAATGHQVRVYDLSQPAPRPPVFSTTFSATLSTSTLPAEVACVLSLQAAPVAGISPRRLRGRIYLGPMASSLITGAGDLRVPPVTMTRLSRAARDLLAGNTVPGGGNWCVLSELSGPHDIVGGFVNDAYDTQRRRGVKPTSKVSFTGSTP